MAIGFRPQMQQQGLAGLMMQQQPQVPNLQMPMPAPVPAPEAPRDRSDLWRIIGAIGDGLQVAGGGQATFGPAMMQMRDQQAQEQAFREKLQAEAEQRRQDREARMADAIALKEWERANPGSTSLQRDFEYFRQQPGNEAMTIGQFMDVYRPQMVMTPDGPGMVQRGAAPQGLTPLTPDEIRALGLPEGGPQASPAGGFRPGY